MFQQGRSRHTQTDPVYEVGHSGPAYFGAGNLLQALVSVASVFSCDVCGDQSCLVTLRLPVHQIGAVFFGGDLIGGLGQGQFSRRRPVVLEPGAAIGAELGLLPAFRMGFCDLL